MLQRSSVLFALFSLCVPLFACDAVDENIDQGIERSALQTAQVLPSFSSKGPVAIASVDASEKAVERSFSVKFDDPRNVPTQLKQAPESVRACMAETLRAVRMAGFLDPDLEKYRAPVFSTPPKPLQIECKDQTFIVNFRTVVVGHNDDGPVYSIGEVIWDLLTDAWDKLCREVVCLCLDEDLGRNPTCGCKESDLSSCDQCPTCQLPPF